MKICLLLLLALTMSAGVIARYVPDCDASANAYREQIVKYRDLKLLNKPDKKTGMCGREWKTFGTCCNVTHLAELVNQDKHTIEQSTAELVTELSSMVVFLKLQLIPSVRSVIANLSRKKQNQVTSKDLEKLKSFIRSPALCYLRKENSTHVEIDLKAHLSECWNFQATLRSKAVCSTCSANSWRFFKNKLGIVNMDICRSLVDKRLKARNPSFPSCLCSLTQNLRHLRGSKPQILRGSSRFRPSLRRQ